MTRNPARWNRKSVRALLAQSCILVVVLVGLPQAAHAYDCTGKDGQYCCGSDVCICDSGDWVFQDECLWGCEGAGPNAKCKAKPFCSGKSNGKWCNGNTLVTCASSSISSQQNCQYGCGGSGPNAYCKVGGYCAGKSDGEWCHNNEMYICDNDEVAFIDGCLYGCNEGDGPDADCSPAPDFCNGKSSGKWCKNDKLVTCSGGVTTSKQSCQYGCAGNGPNAYCQSGGYCAGKSDGEWCHNNEMYICDNEEVAFIDGCLYGCNEGDGPDADCTPKDPPTGHCADKADGEWCHNNDIYICISGETTFVDDCLSGCDEGTGPDAECSGGAFCDGKQNGYWCNQDTGNLVKCIDFLIDSVKECPPTGCIPKDLGEDDVCAEPGPELPPEFCDDQPDTYLCDSDFLVHCVGGEVASTKSCPYGCQINWPDAQDACAEFEVDPGFCTGKAGYWCADEFALVWCNANVVAAIEECPTGCASQAEGDPDLCGFEDPASFCATHDGTWCNGPTWLITCESGQVNSETKCPVGCFKNSPGYPDGCNQPVGCQAPYLGSPISVVVDKDCCASFAGAMHIPGVPSMNQTDYDKEQLGDCEGETIKTWGCLITSFSMFYEFVGVKRKLNGNSLANNPKNENKWRTKSDQGYACCLDDDDKCPSDKPVCCAYWNTNPPNFGGVSPIGNSGKGDCLLSVQAANSIAAELNTGSPILTWVTSSSTTQHWLLVVGVASDGVLLLNDPWGGTKGSKFNSSDGLGPYASIVTMYARGGIGAAQEPEETPEAPQRIEVEGHAGPAGVSQWTEEGQSEHEAILDYPESETYGRGCSAQPGTPTTLLWLAVLLLVALHRLRAVVRDNR